MLTKSGLDITEDTDYRLGIQAVTIFGEEAYMHAGFWQTYAIYIPKYKASVAINFTRNGSSKYLIKKVITILDEFSNEK